MNVKIWTGKINTVSSVNLDQNITFKNTRSDFSDDFVSYMNELNVFKHHIYEYKKGLRNLVLTTEKSHNEEIIKKTLEKNKIAYVIHHINKEKINVYFGAPVCVEVVKTLNPLINKISPSEDFILGIMLGYDRLEQCKRYLKLRDKLQNTKGNIGENC